MDNEIPEVMDEKCMDDTEMRLDLFKACKFDETYKFIYKNNPKIKKFKYKLYTHSNELTLRVYNFFDKKKKTKDVISDLDKKETIYSFKVIEKDFAFITAKNYVDGMFIFCNNLKIIKKIINLKVPKIPLGTYEIKSTPMGYAYHKIQPQKDCKVILSKNLDKDIKKDIEFFFNNKKVYTNNKFPYKRGILLYGSPGNGKTTMIRNLIESYREEAYTFLCDKTSNISTSLFEYMKENTLNKPKIVVIEDIDRLYREDVQILLNAIDGVFKLDNIYIVATCNDLSKVDPALLNRPSRFDKIYLIDDPDRNQRRRFLKLYFPELNEDELKECSEATKGFNGAFFKEIFINSKINKSTARESIEDIKKRLNQFKSKEKGEYVG